MALKPLHDAPMVQVDCDLRVRRSRSTLYAVILKRTDSDIVLRLTDFQQTIDISMSCEASRALAEKLTATQEI